MQAIEARGSGAQAHLALEHLGRMLAWAAECGEFGTYTSPLTNVRPAAWIDHKQRPRDRILNSDELRAVWIAACRGGYPYGHAVRLLLLTGQRLREVADLSWKELTARS